ncbi:MAG: hypothetical protein JO264_17935 [Acidisphaera sp.]|nr:hypothetical protein [Acidisphaera sp.]
MTRLEPIRSAAAEIGRQLRARIAARPAEDAAQSVLCLSVSESGWRSTLIHTDGAPPETAVEGAISDQAPTPLPGVLRRAVRAVTTAQRERIGSVRLLVADPTISVVDNRSARIRSSDPVAIRQAGAQELGSKGAIYGFQPFGSSSEHEVERGIFAFISTERAQDYLAALDSLAVKLVQIVPTPLLRLAGAAGPPFATIDVRATSSTLILADPETGAVACRELPVGVHSFAAAIAEATSIPMRDAAEGMERRACFRPDAGADGAVAALTATERAVGPLLAALRTELLASLEYFVFQRLSGAPERLEVTGEAARVCGLSEWIGRVFELTPAIGADLHDQFVAMPARGSANLLEDAPKGLLKIGKAEYRFIDGRFRPDQPIEAARPGRPARPVRGLFKQPVTAAVLRELLASVDGTRAVLPGLALAGLVFLLWTTVAAEVAEANRSTDVLTARLTEDAILRTALVRRTRPPPDEGGTDPLTWTEKLLAIARAVPGGMWLTKATASADAAKAGVDSRLVLEGEVPSSSDDYLGRITGLIDRLSGDAAFMRGVASIHFDGASVTHGPEGDLAEFTITIVLGAPAKPPPGAAPPVHG